MLKALLSAGAICALSVPLLSLEALGNQEVEDFYRKNNITIVIGYNPGGTYDIYARLAAKHLPRHIPGNPSIIAQNVPGVASLKAANYLYEQAARDGSVIGVVGQGVALQQVLKHPAARYNAREFNWLGRMTTAVEVTIVWHTVPVTTIEDARKREVIIGATSARSSADTNHKLMNALAGTKFNIVLGYRGTTGAMLAMERGEVEGSLAVVQNLLIAKPEWIQERKVSVLVQYSQNRHKAFPDVPAMVEFGDTPEDKEILSLYGSTAEIGRAIMAPQGIPRDRLSALRTAFDAMLQDREFLAEMKERNMELDPLSGAELQKLIDQTYEISPKSAARAAAIRE